MLERSVHMEKEKGLHLRPAGELSALALNFRCKSQMVIGSKVFNLKSVLSVLSAQVAASSEIILQCDGVDEEEAMETLAAFLAESEESRKESREESAEQKSEE